MIRATTLKAYAEHDGGPFLPVNAAVVGTWPVGSFAENIAVHSDGTVFVTLHSPRRIDRYDPATGATTPFADLPAPGMGLAFDAEETLWVTGGRFPKGPGYVWKVTQGGEIRHWADLPDALFINGCTIHPDGRTLLACESLTGRILAIDLREPRRWTTWLSDEILTPGVQRSPGANGIKVHAGYAWISVSARRLILRAELRADGTPGTIETIGKRILADDFAIGASGALYVATHPAQSVVRLEPSGARATLAGPDQGAVGSTACAFGRAPGDETALYVTTNGGLFAPHEGVVQEAKLLRLQVNERSSPRLHGG
jgi:sugar lactone lactonase YvrE